ncbi:MAG TPA: hypothetical protein VFO41_09425 [Alphaproteobacteria bacterium]|nr:hypothetical protein [Alphaproteobacteria bacterium]
MIVIDFLIGVGIAFAIEAAGLAVAAVLILLLGVLADLLRRLS